MVLGNSQGPNFTIVPGGNIDHPDRQGSHSSLALRYQHGPG